MSRSGYSYDCEESSLNLYRANVDRALAGKRGQAFLREMLAALDALPNKRLISEAMESDGEVCAIASVGRYRGTDMSKLDPENYEEWDFSVAVGQAFNIAQPMAAEIMYINDDDCVAYGETPEHRYVRVREWVAQQIHV